MAQNFVKYSNGSLTGHLLEIGKLELAVDSGMWRELNGTPHYDGPSISIGWSNKWLFTVKLGGIHLFQWRKLGICFRDGFTMTVWPFSFLLIK